MPATCDCCLQGAVCREREATAHLHDKQRNEWLSGAPVWLARVLRCLSGLTQSCSEQSCREACRACYATVMRASRSQVQRAPSKTQH